MAISPKNLYPSRVIDGDAEYPYGKALNLQNGIQGTGTPLEEKWVNDQWGFHQALLKEANITPDGIPDAVGASQYMDALKSIHNKEFLRQIGLKVFTSPTTEGTTLVESFTSQSNQVFEVRKTSDNTLATIYSDAAGANEIVQNGLGNKSDSSGQVIFYIDEGAYYITVGSVSRDFSVVNDLKLITTVSDLSAGAFSVGDRMQVSDRFNAQFDIVNTNPFPHYALDAGNGNYAKLVIETEMSILATGATGVDAEPVSLFISRLISSGCKAILIPNKSIQVSSLDAAGVKFVGNNTVVTSGQLKNATLEGVYHIYNNELDELSGCPQLSGDVTSKLIFRTADSGSSRQLGVCTKSGSGDGYVLHTYKDNEGDGSSVSAGAPWGLMRSVFVEPVFSCVVLKSITSADSGGITDLGVNIELIMTEGANNPLNPDGTSTQDTIKAKQLDAGEWVEYSLEQNRVGVSAGKGNVAIYSSGVTSNDFTVTLGGRVIYQGSAAKSGSEHGIWTIDFDLSNSKGAGNSILRVENAVGEEPVYVVGVNYYQLSDAPKNVNFDTWKLWRDNTNPFINISGASDYAIFDADAGVFVGSFHGGETSTSLNVNVDGESYSMTSFAQQSFKIGECVSISQQTNIQGKLSAYVNTMHHVDGVQSMKVNMTGSMNVETFYTMLTPTYREFDYIVKPKYLANGAASTLQNLGRSNDVIQVRSSTEQYVRTAFTKFDVSKNSRGGCYLDNKEGGTSGSIQTRKIYYGPVYSNYGVINDISFEVQREFGKGKY